MNHEVIANQIVRHAPVPIHLIDTKYINRILRRYTNKREDFDLIKMYIYQIKRREAQRVRSYK